MNASELTAQIHAYLVTLGQLTDEAARSAAMQRFLAVCTRFHKYSPNNQLLIFFSNPAATHVAGYTRWQELHRQVRKGEHGIPILAPIFARKDPQDEASPTILKCFKVAYVFDVSQTDGDPLPEPPDWRSPERLAWLHNRLLDYARFLDIQVTEKDLGSLQGYSAGGTIALNPSAGTSVLIHELAHELLHRSGEKLDRPTKELEAEAVSYVVSAHFGLETSSPNYLALWHADSSTLSERQARISACASLIISEIEQKGEQSNEQPQ